MHFPLWLALLLPQANLEPGWRHQFEGTVSNDQSAIAKTLTFDCVVTAGGIYWSTQEDGGGQWPWASRFGRWTAGDDTPVGPSVLLELESATSVIELPLPLFTDHKKLREGNWRDGDRSFTATQKKQQWDVAAKNPYGLKESWMVGVDQPLVKAYRRDVVVGRGERFELALKLKKSQRLTNEELQAARLQFEGLLETRRSLNRSPRSRENQWSKEQLATLRAALPAKPSPVLAAVVNAAVADIRTQGTRANALKKMGSDAVGKSLALNLKLAKIGNHQIRAEQFAGKVVVLHFWDYHSKPLEEPYGQVGYLDFLARSLPAEKTAVLGVVVHDPERTSSESSRDARKLIQFMNISFPVAIDDGLLGKVGDPRKAGAKLPLFVVIDTQGKVAHYHAGLYEVDKRDGLKQLKSQVSELIPN